MIQLNERDFADLCICAFRYALDRDRGTGISCEISRIILKNSGDLASWVKKQMKRDIQKKLERDELRYVYDVENWKMLLDNLE